MGSVNIGANPLQVRIPAPPGLVVGVTDPIACLHAFTAYIATISHKNSPGHKALSRFPPNREAYYNTFSSDFKPAEEKISPKTGQAVKKAGRLVQADPATGIRFRSSGLSGKPWGSKPLTVSA